MMKKWCRCEKLHPASTKEHNHKSWSFPEKSDGRYYFTYSKWKYPGAATLL